MEEFKKKTQEMSYLGLQKAATIEKHLYNAGEFELLKKEWKKRGGVLDPNGKIPLDAFAASVRKASFVELRDALSKGIGSYNAEEIAALKKEWADRGYLLNENGDIIPDKPVSVQSMTYTELRKALTTDKSIYSAKDLDSIKKEWLDRGYSLDENGAPKTSTLSAVNNSNNGLYTKDTQVISTAYSITKFLIWCTIASIILISFIMFINSFETDRYGDTEVNMLLLVSSLIIDLFTAIFGNIILQIHAVLFGLFYDARKIRMIMEKKEGLK